MGQYAEFQQIKKYCELDEFINKDSEELLVKLNKYNSDNIKLELLKDTKTFDVSIIDKKIEIKYSDSDKETFSKYEENLNELEELIKIYKGSQKEKILDLFNQLKVYLDFANKDICNQINSDNIITENSLDLDDINLYRDINKIKQIKINEYYKDQIIREAKEKLKSIKNNVGVITFLIFFFIFVSSYYL